MYKKASRFGQSLRDRGVKPTGQKLKDSKPRRRTSKLATRIDAGVEERTKRDWFRYIEKCVESGTPLTSVPKDILNEWKRKNRG